MNIKFEDGRRGRHIKRKLKVEFSKKMVNDTRLLLWIVTIGGLALAFYCVHKNYVGALGWIAGMESAAWAAHGAVCSFYLNMAKSDHKGADGEGVTFAAAKARNFVESAIDGSEESPAI